MNAKGFDKETYGLPHPSLISLGSRSLPLFIPPPHGGGKEGGGSTIEGDEKVTAGNEPATPFHSKAENL